jgi:hypothetical protein
MSGRTPKAFFALFGKMILIVRKLQPAAGT